MTDLVDRAQAVADEALLPHAQDVDRGIRSPDGGLRALADAGLFGLAGPTSHGGIDASPHEARRTIAAVGSGCGATFFVWVQHHGVVRTMRSSPNDGVVDEWLAAMCTGDVIAGVAFAHLRRPGPPAIRARRLGEGWQLDGHAPWATSWGIADWFCVAAASDHGEVVWVKVPGTPAPGVVAEPLALPVFANTGTVAFSFEGYVAEPGDVIDVVDLGRWRETDRHQAALGQPAVLGVADRAIRLLGAAGGDDAVDAAGRLRAELEARWRHDDDLLDALIAGDGDPSTASEHRAACLHLARRATTALLAATGGRGMDLTHPAQRLAREADFYVIQAQTTDGRAATLRSI